MLQLRNWDALGGGDRDWLKAKHHFAVDSQGNPAHMRLGNLVVWNDDEIAPRSGFPMHSHRDMEIVTYVREGVLHHEDNSGGRGEIRAGNVQAFSAGRGIRHSEYNGGDSPLRLFQIWLLPRRPGLDPHWATKSFADAQRAGRLQGGPVPPPQLARRGLELRRGELLRPEGLQRFLELASDAHARIPQARCDGIHGVRPSTGQGRTMDLQASMASLGGGLFGL